MADDGRRTKSLTSILRGAGFFGIGRVVANALGFATNVLLTQTLGPSLFGIYTFARTILSTLSSVSNLGADKATLRFVSVESEKRGAELGVSYLLAMIGGLIGASGIYLSAPFITTASLQNPLLTFALRVLAVLLIFQSIVTITGNSFRAIDRPELDSLLKQVVQRAVFLALVALAFLFSFGFVEILMAVLVAMSLSSIIGLGLMIRFTSVRPSFEPSGVDLRSYLKYSLPLAFKDAGSVLYTRVDILLVGVLLTASAVAYYQVAILLSAFLTLPLSGINQIFPTIASRLHSDGDYETLEGIYTTATRWILSGVLPAGIGLVVYRDPILSLFGAEFTIASDLLVLFTVGQLSNSFVGPSGYLLMMTDRQFVVTANQWVFGLLNVGLNVWFIEVFGLTGAALATAGVLIAINVARVSEVYYLNGVHPFSSKMLKPVLAAGLAGGAMIGVRGMLAPVPALVFGGILGVAVYLITLAGLGFDERDKEFIREIRG